MSKIQEQIKRNQATSRSLLIIGCALILTGCLLPPAILLVAYFLRGG